MCTFDVPFYQVDMRGEATLVTRVHPQTCGSSSHVFFQKSKDVRRIKWLLDRGGICSWERRIAYIPELDLGRRAVDNSRGSLSPRVLRDRSHEDLETVGFAGACVAIRGVTRRALARVVVTTLPVGWLDVVIYDAIGRHVSEEAELLNGHKDLRWNPEWCH